jgi:peroxiredoxin
MPLAPFAPRPLPRGANPRRARWAVLAATVGIGAALLAYAISPGVRHAIRRAAGSVKHAVVHAFPDNDQPSAPALPGAVLVGPRVDLKHLHGHPALVSFWTSSCAACGREAAALERFATSRAGRGRIVGVAFAEPLRSARRFVHRHHWTFPNLRDDRGVVGRRYGIKNTRGLPVTFVLDASGHISGTLRGPPTVAQLSSALRRIGK